ncbi:UDP-2,4-diacetamido-2,4,6-trideoxy-beta-L-altropyranose hydrolase [Alteromonas sediminis]|uniref:UDP-2,4-diacetamido-2,4, 6-trideoxy-beta-L-altropyranose hydrolase n=1 Tax=Alteromonas sediminis TaxID=2259342 RepID=A0A3N5Z4J7_9ALTE|nr:UDP-2,4-diacetamido-2,4,6-trideoxy-beta-L-altropyranose hydrolase [Alteromonas sediminis]RPJ64974.1 UDP-2,4-diacetamido-2,4,6-trideoxy-beta-L-altropyranose hydrolase [Alteromonas sediminis]
MHIAFIVQASESIGIGHLMRCLAFAQHLVKVGHKASFLLDGPSIEIARSRQDWDGHIIPFDYAQLNQELEAMIAESSTVIDWFVVDGYQFCSSLLQMLNKHEYKVALFDDGVRSSFEGATAVIDSSRPQVQGEEHFLFGAAFRLLRQEFTEQYCLPVKKRTTLTVSFGGSDPFSLTLPILKALEATTKFSEVTVVIGPGNRDTMAIEHFSEQSKMKLHCLHNAQNMASVWSNARLAISAAGGSQFELAVCETPSLLVVVADNQKQASRIAEQEGWAKTFVLNRNKDELVEAIADEALSLWFTEERLEEMQSAVSGKYDALGAMRITECLEKLSVNH